MINTIDELMKELDKYFKAYVAQFTQNQEQLVALREGHKTIRCLFPDHNDSNPSMMLNDTNAHCFKCGTMNIFKAANVFEGKPLTGEGFIKENVLYLAGLFGVEFSGLNKESSEEVAERIKVLNFFSKMKEYIVANIDTTSTEYVLGLRGIPKDIARKMGIGYLDFNGFNNFLMSQGMNPGDYTQYGYNQNNFSNTKMTFIFEDENSRPVSFSVREMHFEESKAREILLNFIEKERVNKTSKKGLKDLIIEATSKGLTPEQANFVAMAAETAKYVNGNENIAFKKNELLYGLNVAKENKSIFSSIYLVEGNMDSITAMKNGNLSVAAYCSGDINEKQLEKLYNIGFKKVIFLPDNDETGHKKIKKIIKENKNKKINLEIANIKQLEGYKQFKDLDECLVALNNNNYNDIKIEQVVETKSILLAEYELLKIEGIEDKEILNELSESASSTENPLEREFLLKELKGKVPDEDLDLIRSTSSFLIQYRKENMAKELEKESKVFIAQIKDDPMNFEEGLLRFKDEMRKKFNGKMKNRKSFKEMSIEQSRRLEERKQEKKDKRFFSFSPLDDLTLTESAFIALAGKPNTGKTQVLVNAAINALINDRSAAVLFVSLDDVFSKVKNRFLANLANINTSFVADPFYNEHMGLYTSQKDMSVKMKFQQAYQMANKIIEDWMLEDRLIILGSDSGISTIYDLEAVCKEHSSKEKVKDANKLLIVDPSSKLIVPEESDKNKSISIISNFIKNVIIPKYDYTALQNYELTKAGLTKKRFTRIEDISGSKAVQYDSDVIYIIAQPLHDLGTEAQTYWIDDNGKTNPIIIVINEKDKVSSKKGRDYFYKLEGNKGKMIEYMPTEQEYGEVRANYMSDRNKYIE